MTLAISLPPDASAADNLSELRPSYAERRAGVATLGAIPIAPAPAATAWLVANGATSVINTVKGTGFRIAAPEVRAFHPPSTMAPDGDTATQMHGQARGLRPRPGGQLVSMPQNARDSRVCSKGTSLKLTDSIASYATLVALQVKPRR
jgi:hypothetical protein